MMKNDKKIVIKVESQEQQENVKSNRRNLKVIQQAGTDKENFVGRQQTFKEVKIVSDVEKSKTKRKKLLMHHKSVQTGDCVITSEDLTSDEPSSNYWRKLAEKRGDALNESLQEIEKLKETVDTLQEENQVCKEMLDQSRNLVEILQEMINEQSGDDTEETADAS